MADIDNVKKLITQCENLINKSVTSKDVDFEIWYSGVERYLAEYFGSDSQEYNIFHRRTFAPRVRMSGYTHDDSIECVKGLKVTLSELVEYKEKMQKDVVDDDSIISNQEPIVFISHKSSSKVYGDALEELLMNMGLKKEQIIYTSHPLHKIPLGKNIYSYLRENLSKKVFVIFLLSNEYLESSICLCEMGATWVIQADYMNVYEPNFDFYNKKYIECPIDKDRMGITLNGDSMCLMGIIELRDKILKMFDLQVGEPEWNCYLSDFLKEIRLDNVINS